MVKVELWSWSPTWPVTGSRDNTASREGNTLPFTLLLDFKTIQCMLCFLYPGE